MSEQDDRKRVQVWLEDMDIEVIEGMQQRYGCSKAAAIRACIRITRDVKLSLERPAPIIGE